MRQFQAKYIAQILQIKRAANLSSAALHLLLRPDNEQIRHGGDHHPGFEFKTEGFKPVSTEFDLRYIYLAELVKPSFGLDFQAAHLGAPEGFRFVGSHSCFVFKKRSGGAANQQNEFESTGLSPALRRTLSLISKLNELHIHFVLLVRTSKIKK